MLTFFNSPSCFFDCYQAEVYQERQRRQMNDHPGETVGLLIDCQIELPA
ncbi:MAG: hypothetical protein AB7O38_25035 [Pirellulaceae bacterium]